jgi:hypothetical protein
MTTTKRIVAVAAVLSICGCGNGSSNPNPSPEGDTAAVAESLTRFDFAWNLKNDFDGRNPTHDWQFGWRETPTAPFQAYTYAETTGYGPLLSPDASLAPPLVWKNTTAQTLCGVAPGEVSLHPGPSNQYSVVRWTAPEAMRYEGRVGFGAGDIGTMDYVYARNGTIDEEQYSSEGMFIGMLHSVDAGDQMEFMVGRAYYYGNTPLNARIWRSDLTHLEAEFETQYNPTYTWAGRWQWGWMANADSPFTPYTTAWTDPATGCPVWGDASHNAPIVWKNTTAQTLHGVAPNQVSAHPGPNGELSGVCFTPLVSISLTNLYNAFGEGDLGVEDYYVFVNGALTANFLQSAKSEQRMMWFREPLHTGDTVCWMVGGSYYYGNTPIIDPFVERLEM